MKKIVLVFLILLGCLLNGCSSAPVSSSDSPSLSSETSQGTHQPDDSELPDDLSDSSEENMDANQPEEPAYESKLTINDCGAISEGELLFDITNNRLDGDFFQGILGFLPGNKLLYMTNNQEDSSELLYFTRDLAGGEPTLVGRGQMPTMGTTILLMENRYLYSFHAYAEETEISNRLLCLDIEEKEEELIRSAKLEIPLVYLDKYSEQEFLMLCRTLEPENQLKSAILRYNVDTGEEKEVLSFLMQGGEDYNTGEMIEQFCTIDGKIYVVVNEQSADGRNRTLQIFSGEGELEREIRSAALEDFLGESSTAMINCVGPYLFLYNHNSGSIVFRIEGDDLVVFIPEGEGITCFSRMEEIISSEDQRYVYFERQLDTAEKDEEFEPIHKPRLYRLDTQSGQIDSWEIALDEEFPILSSGSMNPDGTICLYLKRSMAHNVTDMRIYLVDPK